MYEYTHKKTMVSSNTKHEYTVWYLRKIAALQRRKKMGLITRIKINHMKPIYF